MALGGTSNHFRASALRSVGGWDAYNVTEDADLGLRLARFGFEIRSLPSTTWEDALGTIAPWLKQRRRWTKGWMQTLLVLARDHSAMRDLGAGKSALVAMMLTHLVTGPVLTPIVLVIMAANLCHGLPAPTTSGEAFETALAAMVLATGIVSTLWCGAVGVRLRSIAGGSACLPLLLPYQLLISLAAWCGLWDLCRSPYHWHKTEHGTAPRLHPRRS